MAAEDDRPFAERLHAIVAAQGTTNRVGNVVWTQFAEKLPTIHYETLRKLLAGERALDVETIEEIAQAAGVPPETFIEYRVLLARQLFDVRAVGYDQAVANLRAYFGEQVPSAPKQRAHRPCAEPS